MEPVVTYYLEMLSPDAIVARDSGGDGLDLRECVVKQYRYNKFLYQFVGGPWEWRDKLVWSDDQWSEYAQSDDLRTWVAYRQGAPAGYFELQKQTEGNVEIVYFGLAEKFIGNGNGGWLLSQALLQAWRWPGTRRVWVHTCSLDHPGALGNYRARGMVLYRTERDES